MMRGTRSAGLLAAVALVPAACSSGGTATTPEGFARANGAKVSVAYPKGWKTNAPASRSMTVAVSSQNEDAEIDAVENLLAHGAEGDEGMLVDTVEAGPMMNARDYHRTGTRSVGVKGAKAAERIDYTFTDPKKGPCQAVDVGILGRDRQIHVVRVIWQRGRLDGRTVDGIIGSIEAR